MSDALTDIARDEARSEAVDRLINAFLAFILESGPAERAIVHHRAQQCDGIRRGYWGGPTKFEDGVDKTLDGLAANDPQAWAWLLCLARGQGHSAMGDLLQRSPWAGKRMDVVVFDRHADGLARLLAPFMHKAGNGTTFSFNPSGYFKYAVFFMEEDNLLTIARSAVPLGYQIDSYSTDDKVPYAPPISHRLEDLQARADNFQRLYDARNALRTAQSALAS